MTTDNSVTMVRWGVLGTGAIARQFAEALNHAGSGKLVCVGTRAAMNSVPAAFSDADLVIGYDNLLARDDIDAVYVATPHPSHVEWTIKAVKQGKHVLCEKPIALNTA